MCVCSQCAKTITRFCTIAMKFLKFSLVHPTAIEPASTFDSNPCVNFSVLDSRNVSTRDVGVTHKALFSSALVGEVLCACADRYM